MNRAYRKRVALSKANLDTEIRNIVAKISFRPRADIIQFVRERTSAQIDADYLDTLLKGARQWTTE